MVLAEDEDDLKYMLRKLIEEYGKWGLEVNTGKTQYLAIGVEGADLDIDGRIIKNVPEYNYLGVLITKDGNDERDILSKVGKGKAITSQLNSSLWNVNIRKDIKKRIFTSIVESTVTYGAEVWTIKNKGKKKINTVENGFWRRCCRLTLEDRVTNHRIKEMMEVNVPLNEMIEKKTVDVVWPFKKNE